MTSNKDWHSQSGRKYLRIDWLFSAVIEQVFIQTFPSVVAFVHLFNFSPLCVIKCILKLLARENA